MPDQKIVLAPRQGDQPIKRLLSGARRACLPLQFGGDIFRQAFQVAERGLRDEGPPLGLVTPEQAGRSVQRVAEQAHDLLAQCLPF